MKVVSSALAVMLAFVLSFVLGLPVHADSMEDSASSDLIATLEKARDVREKADIKIKENLKLMASSCLFMSDSLKELYRRSHCDDPIILREQLRQVHRNVDFNAPRRNPKIQDL